LGSIITSAHGPHRSPSSILHRGRHNSCANRAYPHIRESGVCCEESENAHDPCESYQTNRISIEPGYLYTNKYATLCADTQRFEAINDHDLPDAMPSTTVSTPTRLLVSPTSSLIVHTQQQSVPAFVSFKNKPTWNS
jgi:hypothetical protein